MEPLVLSTDLLEMSECKPKPNDLGPREAFRSDSKRMRVWG